MNTPKSCCSCKHCGYDVMREDDPTDEAYCKKELPMGRISCNQYIHWETK